MKQKCELKKNMAKTKSQAQNTKNEEDKTKTILTLKNP